MVKGGFTYSQKRPTIAGLIILLVFIAIGLYLFVYTHFPKNFTEKLLIYDLMRLDFWSLLFLFSLILVWVLKVSARQKFITCMLMLSIYLIVTNQLLLNGTPFYLFGFGGDQAFRQAMILKFATFLMPGDFYYKDMVPFYPPLYYYLESLYSRIFSVEAYKMSKIGQVFIFAITPMLLYFFWRKMVSPIQSFFVSFLTFVCSNHAGSVMFFSPHSFLAYSFFVPWLIYFVEQVTNPVRNWKFYLSGGLIGAAIFLTYSYVVFIGGIFLILRLLFFRNDNSILRSTKNFARKSGLIVVIAALLASPYWFPLLISIFSTGADRSRGGWFHIGYTGISFPFVEFTLLGMLYLGAIIFLFRRLHRPIYRGLIVLVVSIVALHLAGQGLGAFKIDINTTKSSDVFVYELAGPVIGFMLAAFIRREEVFKKRWRVFSILTIAALLVCLNNIEGIAKSDGVKRARTAYVPTWGTNEAEMKAAEGKVFLTTIFELPSFYPIYNFYSVNEHYAHPASEYLGRFQFVSLLSEFNDPALINMAFKHNRFDEIDYFMPGTIDNKYGLTFSFSNYPNKSYPKVVRFDKTPFQESDHFEKLQGNNLYQVCDLDRYEFRNDIFKNCRDFSDSLKVIGRLYLISEYLEGNGREIIDKKFEISEYNWHKLLDGKQHIFADSILLTNVLSLENRDSLYFLFTFITLCEMKDGYNIYLVLQDTSGSLQKFSFIPTLSTGNWNVQSVVLLSSAIPLKLRRFDFSLGLCRDEDTLACAFRGKYPGKRESVRKRRLTD